MHSTREVGRKFKILCGFTSLWVMNKDNEGTINLMKSPLKSSQNSLMKSKLTGTTSTLNIIAIPYYLFYFFLFKWMFSRVCIFLTDILEMKIRNVGPSHIHETKINFKMIERHLSDTRHLLSNHIIHQNI
jgi:hypothetical protein